MFTVDYRCGNYDTQYHSAITTIVPPPPPVQYSTIHTATHCCTQEWATVDPCFASALLLYFAVALLCTALLCCGFSLLSTVGFSLLHSLPLTPSSHSSILHPSTNATPWECHLVLLSLYLPSSILHDPHDFSDSLLQSPAALI